MMDISLRYDVISISSAMEPSMGVEPMTPPLPRVCSTD
jgi:hypothetical protein